MRTASWQCVTTLIRIWETPAPKKSLKKLRKPIPYCPMVNSDGVMTALVTLEFPAQREPVGAHPASVVSKISSATCLVSVMYLEDRVLVPVVQRQQRGADLLTTLRSP